MDTRQRQVPVAIAIAPLQGARSYRVQISADPSFATVLFDAVAPTPVSRGPDLPDGHYVLRARGIDVQGLEGHDALAAFEVDARPFPPVLLEPKDDSVISAARPSFEWTLQTLPARYRLQVAADEAFQRVVLEVSDWTTSSWSPDRPLPPGRYYWRMGARDERDGEGPIGSSRSFRIPPAPPVLTAPQATDTADTVTLAWSTAAGAARYDIQISRDPDFGTILYEARRDVPDATIAKPVPGLYYVRVRSVDAEGTPSPFTEAQTFRRAPPPPAASGDVVGGALVVQWPPGTEGWRYDVQVARDESFASLLATVRTAANAVTIPRSDAGLFHLRVRTVDTDGFEGPFGTPILLRRDPSPPALSGRFADDTLMLQWPAAAPGWRYDIDVARDERFEPLIASLRTSAPAAELRMPPGRYLARIRALDADGHAGPYGTAIEVRRAPAPPALEWAEMLAYKLTIAWSGGAAGCSYRMQLARDAGFNDIVLDETVTGPAAQLPLPPAGPYFVRVSAITADGLEGSFSAARRFSVPRSPLIFWTHVELRKAKRP